MSRLDDWADYLDADADAEVGVSLTAGEREALNRIRELVADPVTWSGPPAGLAAGVFERLFGGSRASTSSGRDARVQPPGEATPDRPVDAAADDDVEPAGGGHGDVIVPLGTDEDVQAVPAHGRRWRWFAAGGGIAAAIVVFVVVMLGPGKDDLRSYPVAGTSFAPAASAAVTLDPRPAGVAIVVKIDGLSPSSTGSYYAVWLRGDAGTVPVGSFHWRRGSEPLKLWSGVTAEGYPEFFITRQREGEPALPSVQVVLRGHLQ